MNDSTQELKGGLSPKQFIYWGLNIIGSSPQFQEVYNGLGREGVFPDETETLIDFINPNFRYLTQKQKIYAIKRILYKYQLPMPGERNLQERLAAPRKSSSKRKSSKRKSIKRKSKRKSSSTKKRCRDGYRRGSDQRCHKK